MPMCGRFYSLVLAFITLVCVAHAQLDANKFCFSCVGLREHKNLWPVEGDCHSFYHCFFYNSTFATGVVQQCPVGTFYHDEMQGCLPEGPQPCQDLCRQDDVQARGCYGITGRCSTYFVCSNTASYPFCCPPGTSFSQSSCSCVNDLNCTDVCTIVPQAPTTIRPPTILEDSCIDSFGNTLLPDNSDPSRYFVLDSESKRYTMSCAPGSQFVLSACLCNRFVDIVSPVANTQCDAYFPFDNDAADHSINKFITYPSADSSIDHTVFARGGGSLSLPGGTGRVEVAGLQTFDFGRAASFCFFFQCVGSSANPLSCLANGNLLANTNNPNNLDCTIDFASLTGNGFWGNVTFDRPFGSRVVTGPVNVGSNGFNQICVTYDGEQVKLYINKALYSTESVTGHLKMAHCTLTIGYGHHYGGFAGHIDEVLICRRAFSADDVATHFTGQNALRAAGMVP